MRGYDFREGQEWPRRANGHECHAGARPHASGTLDPVNAPVSKLARCAIYTRKSTEYNLELAFNSLDAQREACEAYIRSQAHEGWRLIPGRYDDGAFSGASLERPALQQLLADVRAGKIDIVLVYKVDRLTRSLADFAKLVELFDAHGVSFVSVTQAFNTSSSMGRLTLNVLLSFAQFERELIGERVRDKIVASKRKGLWVGGPVPLGYAAVDKKIVVVPTEAEAVRTIFARYLELGSIRTLAQDLDRRGIRSKRRRLSNGRTTGGGRFGVGALAHLLKNSFYIGEVAYRGEVHRGEHEPILEPALFEAVQGKLAAQAVARRSRLRGFPALLTGRLFDERGSRMSPSHSNKGGARYRYYVSQAMLQGKPPPVGKRVAAEKHQVRAAPVDPERDLSPVVRISEFNTSEAILIPLKVGERMVQRCRADPPRLLKIVLRALHGLCTEREATLVGPQDGSRRYAQHQMIDSCGPERQVRMSTTPVGTWVGAKVGGRCPHLESRLR
jgi:DNA invertase Pin-like site-specific DNA recombinase